MFKEIFNKTYFSVFLISVKIYIYVGLFRVNHVKYSLMINCCDATCNYRRILFYSIPYNHVDVIQVHCGRYVLAYKSKSGAMVLKVGVLFREQSERKFF